MASFEHTITEVSGLRDHYRDPSHLVQNKATDHLDDGWTDVDGCAGVDRGHNWPSR